MLRGVDWIPDHAEVLLFRQKDPRGTIAFSVIPAKAGILWVPVAGSPHEGEGLRKKKKLAGSLDY